VIPGEKGYGTFKDGSWFGMRTFMKRPPGGVHRVLPFNASMQPDVRDARTAADAVQEVRQAVERRDRYPDLDLFDEYR
jgi:hypothetical protein